MLSLHCLIEPKKVFEGPNSNSNQAQPNLNTLTICILCLFPLPFNTSGSRFLDPFRLWHFRHSSFQSPFVRPNISESIPCDNRSTVTTADCAIVLLVSPVEQMKFLSLTDIKMLPDRINTVVTFDVKKLHLSALEFDLWMAVRKTLNAILTH